MSALLTEIKTWNNYKHTGVALKNEIALLKLVNKTDSYYIEYLKGLLTKLKVRVFSHYLKGKGWTIRYKSSGDSISTYMVKDDCEIRLSDHEHPNSDYYNGWSIRINHNTTWYALAREIVDITVFGWQR